MVPHSSSPAPQMLPYPVQPPPATGAPDANARGIMSKGETATTL